jgi:LPXTG-motif cell wall-anchored protein
MISDYPDINPGDLLELWRIPVTAAWSITPDEPYLGGTVSNAIITHPSVTHAEVVAGSLPAGVTLNETTGQVDGTFAQPGAFDVTIAADTLCGSSELTWSGTVSGSASNALPETGRNVENFAAVLGIGALSFIAGLFITAIRWRRKAPHTL